MNVFIVEQYSIDGNWEKTEDFLRKTIEEYSEKYLEIFENLEDALTFTMREYKGMRIFENLRDARYYAMMLGGIFKSQQRLRDGSLLHENWIRSNDREGFYIYEYCILKKFTEYKKNWKFRYKVYHQTDDKEQLFKFVDEIEDEEKYPNAELAKIAADDILRSSNIHLSSSQKWQAHIDPDGEVIYAKNVYVTGECVDNDEELFYQFQVYKECDMI